MNAALSALGGMMLGFATVDAWRSGRRGTAALIAFAVLLIFAGDRL